MRQRQSGGLFAGMVVPPGQPLAGSSEGDRRIRVLRAGLTGVPLGTEIGDAPVHARRSNGSPRSSCWLNRPERMIAFIHALALLRAGDDVSCTNRASTVSSAPLQ